MKLFALGHAGHRTCKTPSHDRPGLETFRKLSSQMRLVLIGSRVGMDFAKWTAQAQPRSYAKVSVEAGTMMDAPWPRS
jgi:hypothetical protein